MTDHQEMLKICDTLRRFAALEGSEYGDYCLRLVGLYVQGSSMMGDTFRETVARELRDELEEFKLAFTIKTRTIETTREEQYLEELQ